MKRSFTCLLTIIFFAFNACKVQQVSFAKVGRDTAYKMIGHYLDPVNVSHKLEDIIKSIALTKEDVKALHSKNVVRLKFLTAADLKTHNVTVLIQQKIRKGKDSSYVYYDMKSTRKGMLMAKPPICPLPPDCAPTIED